MKNEAVSGVVVNNDTVVDQFDLCANTSTGAWVRRSVNLSAYTGQSIQIQIRAETDGSYNSNLFVDDVSLGIISSSPTVSDNLVLDSTVTFNDKVTQLPFSAETKLAPPA